MTSRFWGGALSLFFGALILLQPLVVKAESGGRLSRVERAMESLEEDVTRLQRSLRSEDLAAPRHVEERLTDAELLFNMQDYTRASILYLDVVENYPRHPGFPEALHRLAECLFNTNNYYGARTRYREILDRANQPIFRDFAQLALGRLIEIAIHLDQFEGVETYFTRLSQLPPSEVTSATHYARGRFLFHREEFLAARQAFALVDQENGEYLRAQYHIAVIHVTEREFQEAVQIFTRISRTDPETSADRQVVDLSHIGIGAIYLELDQPEEAIRAYQDVSRNSRHFDQALYQAAAAFTRMGDSTRAEQVLEVLTVAAPDSHYIPRAKILRGNLLLDTGRYSEARDVFHDIVREFRPVREELDEVLRRERDPAAYFQELVRANMEVFDISSFLPPLAVRWVREEEGFRRAMDTLSRMADCTRQLDDTERLLVRLEAAVAGPSSVNIFPELRATAIEVTQLNNQLTGMRSDILAAEQGLGGASRELAQIQQDRQQLEDERQRLPDDPESYDEREDEARSEYRQLAAEVSRINGRIDRLQAMSVAIELYLRQTEPENEAEEAGMEAFQGELRVHRNAIESYREEILAIRTMIETGQIRVGVGDAQDVQDRRLRERYNELARREHQLISRESSGGNARRASELFERVEAAQRNLDRLDDDILGRADRQITELRDQLETERRNLARYERELATLEREAEDVIGHAAYQNFQRVRDRFYDLVRQADVGIIDVAWAEREEHRHRIDMLSEESRAQLQMLDDEFRDVMEEQSSESSGAQ